MKLDIETILGTPVPIKNELLSLFKKNDSKLIFFDVGACTGEDSIRYAELFPNATIFAFEPLDSNIEVMKMHITQYASDKKIIVERLACSDKNGESDFYISGGLNPDIEEYTSILPKEWNKSSSLLPPSEILTEKIPWLEFKQHVKVTTRRLDGFLKERNIPKIDFLHMDVQGAELQVIKGLGNRIKSVAVIWAEVSNEELYKGQPLKHEISSYLKKQGFFVMKDTSNKHIQGDILYINGLITLVKTHIKLMLKK